MATFIDCGHDNFAWMAFKGGTRVLVNPVAWARTLKELTELVGKKNYIFTSGCLTCAEMPPKGDKDAV